MEMLSPHAALLANERIRPLKRVEYEQLAAAGCFENEKVELLFGMVVEMTPIDGHHVASVYWIREHLARGLQGRAMVLSQSPFAATDDSEPEPDAFVIPNRDLWVHDHPDHAYLVVEVARTSLDRDQGPKAQLYGSSQVDEYWIVNHVAGVVEVYRDRHEGTWRHHSVHRRGETVAMARFPDVQLAVSEILPPE